MDQKKLVTRACLFGIVCVLFTISSYYAHAAYAAMENWSRDKLPQIHHFLQNNLIVKDNLYHIHETLKEYFVDPAMNCYAHIVQKVTSPGSSNDRKTLESALTYRKTDKVDVSFEEAQRIIKNLQYSVYLESNMCDIFEGIDGATFDTYIDGLAKEVGLPDKLTDNIKMSRHGKRRMRGVQNFGHRQNNGTLYFGRFAVVRRDKDEFDLAYSIHSLTYELQPNNDKKDAGIWGNFVSDANSHISAYEDGFFAYFQHKAIDRFNQQCAVLINDSDKGLGVDPSVAEILRGKDKS